MLKIFYLLVIAIVLCSSFVAANPIGSYSNSEQKQNKETDTLPDTITPVVKLSHITTDEEIPDQDVTEGSLIANLNEQEVEEETNSGKIINPSNNFERKFSLSPAIHSSEKFFESTTQYIKPNSNEDLESNIFSHETSNNLNMGSTDIPLIHSSDTNDWSADSSWDDTLPGSSGESLNDNGLSDLQAENQNPSKSDSQMLLLDEDDSNTKQYWINKNVKLIDSNNDKIISEGDILIDGNGPFFISGDGDLGNTEVLEFKGDASSEHKGHAHKIMPLEQNFHSY